MSAPFTINASNFQLVSKMEELRIAVSERSRMLSAGWVYWNSEDEILQLTSDYDKHINNGFSQGVNCQDYKIWSALQSYAYACIFGAINPDNDYSGWNATGPSPTYYSIYGDNYFLAFCSEIGGGVYGGPDDYGFRRWIGEYNEDGTKKFQRGYAQNGDYLGSWIIDDLKSILSHIRASQGTPSSTESSWTAWYGDSVLHVSYGSWPPLAYDPAAGGVTAFNLVKSNFVTEYENKYFPSGDAKAIFDTNYNYDGDVQPGVPFDVYSITEGWGGNISINEATPGPPDPSRYPLNILGIDYYYWNVFNDRTPGNLLGMSSPTSKEFEWVKAPPQKVGGNTSSPSYPGYTDITPDTIEVNRRFGGSRCQTSASVLFTCVCSWNFTNA